MIKKCKQCHSLYTVGKNGLSDGRCDKCAGVQRAPNGDAWFWWEQSQTRMGVDSGNIREVSREEGWRMP